MNKMVNYIVVVSGIGRPPSRWETMIGQGAPS